jgi:uncharacterized membrane protein
MKLAKICLLVLSLLVFLPAFAYAANKNISINAGWNQISIPYVEPIEKNDFVQGCAGVVAGSIKEYNSATDSYTDATVLNYGKGYILYSTQKCSFDPADNLTAYNSFNETIQPGKHLIGAPYTPLSASIFYNNCSIKNITEMNAQGAQTKTTTLIPGKGYFIEANKMCDINSAENYDVTLNYAPARIIQGDTGTSTIKLSNTGNRHIKDSNNVTITASAFMHGTAVLPEGTLSKNYTKLNISENDTIYLTFNVPAGQPEGIYTGYITLAYLNYSKTQAVEMEVARSDESVIISAPQQISVMQGNSTTVNFTAANNGNVNLTNVGMSISGLSLNGSAIPSSINPSAISLLKIGEAKNISVSFTPAKNAPAGNYNGNFTASYAGTSKSQQFSVNVGEARRELQIEFTPPAVIQGENATVPITLRNTGTVPLGMFEIAPYSVNCTECSPVEYLGFTLNQTVISSLSTGETKQIKAVVWPSRTQALGNYSGNFIVAYAPQDTETKGISARVAERKENATIAYDNSTAVMKGRNLSSSFQITNTGNVNTGNMTISMSSFGKEGFAITPILNKTSAKLEAGSSERIGFTINAPKTAPEGSYAGAVNISYGGKTSTAPLALTVTEPEGNIAFEHTSSSAMQAETTSQSYITISNTGSADLAVKLNISNLTKGSEAINAQLGTAEMQLLTGEKKNASIAYTIPANASRGEYTGIITAKYQNKSISSAITLNIEGKNESIAFATSEMSWLKEFNSATEGMLNITNNGNTLLNITLAISPLTGAETINSITLSETAFQLGKGEKKTIRMAPNSIEARAGVYSGKINISYNGQLSQAPAVLNVRSPAYGISSSPSQVTIAGDVRGKNSTASFTIKNSGDYDLSSIRLYLEIDKKYNATISPETTSYLGRGSEITGILNISIPQNEDTGSHKIGNIKLESDKVNLSIPVYANPDSALKIRELKAKVDGKSDTVLNGETISKKAEPGSKIKLDIDIENLLSEKDIADVLAEITVDSIDDGDDIEAESSEKDINNEDNEKFTIEFDVPMRVDEKKYEIKIHAEGEDEDNVIHEIDWTVYLNVEKETHQIIIDKAEISPSAISCSRSADAEVKVINIGTEDEDDVEIRIENDELGISEQKSFSLESGSDDDAENIESFSIDVPDGADEKTYEFTIKVYRNGVLEETQTAELEVSGCERISATKDTPKQDEKKTGFVVEKTQQQPASPIVQQAQQASTLDELRESEWYLPALGVVVVVLGATVIALIPK